MRNVRAANGRYTTVTRRLAELHRRIQKLEKRNPRPLTAREELEALDEKIRSSRRYRDRVAGLVDATKRLAY